jgi:outer membrane protein TolC
MWTPNSGGFPQTYGAAGVYSLPAALYTVFINFIFLAGALFFAVSPLSAAELDLQKLINEAVVNNPDLQASGSRADASGYRAPQVSALPDPIFSVGYQNEGFSRYTYGSSKDSQWMYSVSQAVPFPGKLSLKGEAAEKEHAALRDSHSALRLKTIAQIKELYFDLLVTHKTIDLINERLTLLSAVENLALARYAAGRSSQLEALSAQTEKYLLLEKEVTLKQKIETLETSLNRALARKISEPLGRPLETPVTYLHYRLDELIAAALEKSPEIRSRLNSIASAEARLSFAKRDYLPDFTITGGYYAKGGDFENMWSLTLGVNIPIFYLRKQKNAENEAEAALIEARSLKKASDLLVGASLRENFAQMKAAEKLMSLYREGLIPKSRQDFELSLSGYKTGSGDAQGLISKLKSVIDYEIAYWGQFAEHEKAAARIEAVTGLTFDNR